MASLPVVRAAVLVAFSGFLTLILGFGLPVALNFVTQAFGLSEASGTECIVAVYAVFVVYIAMPRLPRGSVKVEGKAVFVTGCDRGFGHALAKHLHRLGFTVFAGCLSKVGEGAAELENMHSDTLKVVQLDVCSEDQVSQAVEFIRANLADPEKGRVVNIASMYGRMGNALRSPYCISKFGVEAFSDCLRYEMKNWGVKVSVIEPGNFIVATGIMTRDTVATTAEKLWKEAPPGVQEDYGKAHFEQHMALMRSYCNSGQRDITPVLEDITDALTSKRPYTRYNPTEPHWWIRMQVMTHLPAALSDRLYF
ncbi:D-beta-hydroxybutyrate dehydrogenase, mitochondrial isoform X2 [Electrophorus electricus]|uniref:D-beta-hydroxybutyrate dehydrogenase, mitochondrial isoform X2 n=1 Tax=Electrophorus electricus TaxID=8005 RepID=UPI000F0A5102|nr:D-beta-hydroxybutyrate dehydrogenase, mitochondrial isoform X2 [Electrophorus electricus]